MHATQTINKYIRDDKPWELLSAAAGELGDGACAAECPHAMLTAAAVYTNTSHTDNKNMQEMGACAAERPCAMLTAAAVYTNTCISKMWRTRYGFITEYK